MYEFVLDVVSIMYHNSTTTFKLNFNKGEMMAKTSNCKPNMPGTTGEKSGKGRANFTSK